MRSRSAAVALVLTLFLTGLSACGDDSTSTTTAREPEPEATVKAPRPSGRRGNAEEYKGPYADAKDICGVSTRKKVAEIVGSKSTRRKDIARELANGYKPRLRKKAYNGCLAGLK